MTPRLNPINLVSYFYWMNLLWRERAEFSNWRARYGIGSCLSFYWSNKLLPRCIIVACVKVVAVVVAAAAVVVAIVGKVGVSMSRQKNMEMSLYDNQNWRFQFLSNQFTCFSSLKHLLTVSTIWSKFEEDVDFDRSINDIWIFLHLS